MGIRHTQVERCFLLDQNLFQHLTGLGNEQKLTTWRQTVTTQGLVRPGEVATIIVTPSTALEALGIVPERFPMVPIPLVGADIPERLAYIFKHAKDFADNSPVLSQNNIQVRYRERIANCSDPGKAVFESCFLPFAEREFHQERIRHSIAWDFMLDYRFDKNEFKPSHMALSAMMLNGLTEGHDYAATRLFKRMQERIPGNKLNRLLGILRVKEIAKHLGFKRGQDLVDLEIAQIAVTGWFQNNVRLPVEINTCDKERKVRDRIGLCKTAFTALREMLEEIDQPMDVFQTFAAGNIHFHDIRTGNYMNSVPVDQILPV
jgi:hypothetical protein